MPTHVDQQRIRALNDHPVGTGKGPVLCWLSRDQRLHDNWSLIQAQDLAIQHGASLTVFFCLYPEFLGAQRAHYRFMLQGLAELETALHRKKIGFKLLTGDPGTAIPAYSRSVKAIALVKDFSPLRINQRWTDQVKSGVNFALHEVDSHNIVPCWLASPKQEYAAYTFRPKIKKLLPHFLTDFPALRKHPYPPEQGFEPTRWRAIDDQLNGRGDIKQEFKHTPGENAATMAMQLFLEEGLVNYERDRNNPVVNGQSGLSPYLHFGQLSAQRLAVMTKETEEPGLYSESFLEELIVRRELADNFCFYNPAYDQVSAFPRWAKESLAEHLSDEREQIYSVDQFEAAETDDPLWNAAQKEMLYSGKMHGYMRMYWAKKILEWTETPAEALKIAILLNDRYSLDGRDPNGYAGIAWSIGGVHDRAWFQRPIFGKVRYMSYRASRSKFDVDRYIAMADSLVSG